MNSRAQRLHRYLRRFAIGAVVAAAVLFALQTFVAGVYLVRTPSMEPTIDGSGVGEWVLVHYVEADAIERFDLVVFAREDDPAPVVKRALGLPSESVQIIAGDLLVDGARLGPSSRWPVLVPIFDSLVMEVDEHFHLGSEDAWAHDGRAWTVDALDVSAGSSAGTIGLHRDVGTGFMRANGERTPDVEQVNDVVATVDVHVLEGTGHVLVEVLEERDRFQARVGPGRAGSGTYVVELWRLDGALEPWATASVPEPEDGAFELRVANVDNRVTVSIDGAPVIERSYDANRPYPGMTEVPDPTGRRGGTVRRSIGQRAVVGGVGVRARFDRIRVERDLYYAVGDIFGSTAIDAPLELGPDELFVLGDNTADSVDGRRFGALREEEIVGRAVAVVWPPSRWRALHRGGARSASGAAAVR